MRIWINYAINYVISSCMYLYGPILKVWGHNQRECASISGSKELQVCEQIWWCKPIVVQAASGIQFLQAASTSELYAESTQS